MDIQKLINRIIPPMDYEHRNGFNNIPIIDILKNDEKLLVENALIEKLINEADNEVDTLIVETLGYLKSEKALPILQNLMKMSLKDMERLIIASSIFEINKNNIEALDIAINSFRKIDNIKDAYYVYKLPSAFIYLAKFKNLIVYNIIKEYLDHKEYLISYNAKRALDIINNE